MIMMWLFALVLSCRSADMHTIPGTTSRIGDPVQDIKTDAEVRILHNKARCQMILNYAKSSPITIPHGGPIGPHGPPLGPQVSR